MTNHIVQGHIVIHCHDIHYIEIYSQEGKLIERRVTEYNGRAIEDTHFSDARWSSRGGKRESPSWKYTTNKNKEAMSKRRGA